MRRLLTLGLLAPLLLVAGPARSEPVYRIPVHGFAPENWSIRSFDCAGESAVGTELTLDRVHGSPEGIGALTVASTDAMGGVLKHGYNHLPSYYVHLRPTSGTAPTLAWQVELNGHVLTSDPIALTSDDWKGYGIDDATLREGDWSGTIQQAVHHFGPADDWWAGVLTGGCLGSPSVQIDEIGEPWAFWDFEPSRWVELDNGRDWGDAVRPGTRFRLDAQVMDTVLDTGVDRPIPNALVNLQRKVGHHWRLIDSARTRKDGTIVFRQVAPKQDATYRAVWRDTDGKIAGTDPAHLEVSAYA